MVARNKVTTTWIVCGRGCRCKSKIFGRLLSHTKDNSFTKPCDLSKQVLTPQGERRFQCDLFPQTFKVGDNLRSNKKRVHVDNLFKCSGCDKSFKCEINLKSHYARMHSSYAARPYGCDYCEKRFFTKTTHHDHLRSHANERPFKCDICGDSFAYESRLRLHKKFHEEHQFHCEFCGKPFLTQNQVKQHSLRMHTKLEEAYHCPKCNKRFRFKEVTIHQRTHIEARRFQCSICLSRFKSKSTLEGHIKTVHETKTLFECDQCPKTFKHKRSLRNHNASIHSRERPCTGLFLPYASGREALLMVHIHVHTKEKHTFARYASTHSAPNKCDI